MDDQGLPRISGSFRLSDWPPFPNYAIHVPAIEVAPLPFSPAKTLLLSPSPLLPLSPAPPSQFKFALFGKNRLRWAGYGQLMLGWRTADRQRTRIVECLIRIFCQYPLQLKSQEHNNG